MITDELKLKETGELETLEPAGDFNEISDVFVLHYRKGGDILSKNFCWPNLDGLAPRDHFHKVIERAKIHCERMRYRFLFCNSYISNLEEDEKRMVI